MDTMNCPNCQSLMNPGDPCPECEHTDNFPDCACRFCEDNRLEDAAGEIELLRERLATIRRKLESIVCTEGADRGVVLLDVQGTTHYDQEVQCQVYDHEHFSPLGDALIELYELTKPETDQ